MYFFSTMILPAIMPIESIMLIMPIMPIITSISSKETELHFLCIFSKENEFSFLEIDITHHMTYIMLTKVYALIFQVLHRPPSANKGDIKRGRNEGSGGRLTLQNSTATTNNASRWATVNASNTSNKDLGNLFF